jgi:hypothetical protein
MFQDSRSTGDVCLVDIPQVNIQLLSVIAVMSGLC